MIFDKLFETLLKIKLYITNDNNIEGDRIIENRIQFPKDPYNPVFLTCGSFEKNIAAIKEEMAIPRHTFRNFLSISLNLDVNIINISKIMAS